MIPWFFNFLPVCGIRNHSVYLDYPATVYALLLTMELLSVFSVRSENFSLDVIFLQNVQGVSSLVCSIVTIIASTSLSIRL